MKSRDVKNVTITSVFLMVFSLIVAASCFASEDSIRYGGQYYPGEFFLQGYPQLWEQAGISVDHVLFSSGSENNQALISGQIDVNCGSDSKTAALFDVLSDKAVVLAVIQKGDRYATVVSPDSGYQSWQDLKGKTVATRLGSGAEQVLRRFFLQEEGLSWEDFNWVNMKTENMIAGLQAGTIEAFTVWEPTPSIAEAQATGRVLRTYGDISQVPVSLHTTKAYAAEHRDVLVRFLSAHLVKARLIKENPMLAAESASKAAADRGQKVSAEAFLSMFKRIDFELDVTEEVKTAHQDTVDFLKEQGKIKRGNPVQYDLSILADAKKLVGE